jgi:hypothetical protein
LKQPPAYRAPWWLPGSHLQTIFPLARKVPLPAYRRERWETPDGDFIELDWVDPAGPPSADSAHRAQAQTAVPHADPAPPLLVPLFVLFHGLEGSSRSHYARTLMQAASARGWRGVVPHFRGCSGTPNRLPRAYHSGDSDEIDWILRRLQQVAGGAPVFAAGVSLGGNALLKWLGERGTAAQAVVDAAAAICAPLDLTISGHALGEGFNRVYTRHFLATLRGKALAKCEHHRGRFDATRIAGARSLDEFDDAYTAPAHGFAGVEDYWRRASARPWLGGIEVPTLVLNAANDPFVPARALPDVQSLPTAVHFDCPDQGGHVGFLAGAWPGSQDWLTERVLVHFDGVR